jgi:hypothetical protein
VAWNQNLTHLRDWFADRYYDAADARRVVAQAGLDPKFITFSAQAATNWFNILWYADNQRAVAALIVVAQQEHPREQAFLLAARQGLLTGVAGPDIHDAVAWRGESGALEKITGARSTLLPIHFLEVGVVKARAVVRVQLAEGGSGSGFLAAGELLITNHHVIPSAAVAQGARIQCNYQLTAALHNAPVEEFALTPDEGFATSAEDDWTAVRVQGEPAARWGALTLHRASPQKDDWINIIQHPAGGMKQIALYNNLIVYVDERRIQYLTDTLPGSSGSPAFDSEWNVIAVHHSGGWLREPGAAMPYFRNEGIHINRVVDGLAAAGLQS